MAEEKGTSLVSIGKIVRTRGIGGEVLVDLLTDFPERFAKLKRVYLCHPDGQLEIKELEGFWFHKGRLVAKFQNVSSIADAERLTSCLIQIPEADLEALPSGTYYDFQLIGCRVMTEDGLAIGKVKEILKAQGNDLLVVTEGQREVLIPLVADFCRNVSVEKKEILVRLPKELLELNRRD